MSAQVRYLKLLDRPVKRADGSLWKAPPSLSKKISGTAGQAFLRRFVNETVEVIEEGLLRDGAVRIHEFGTFQLKWHKQRLGRNPRTGETIIIPGQNRIVFRPAKNIAGMVNQRYAALEPEFIEPPPIEVKENLEPVIPTFVADEIVSGEEEISIPAILEPAIVPPSQVPLRLLLAEESEEPEQETEVMVGTATYAAAPVDQETASETGSKPRLNGKGTIRWFGSFLAVLVLMLLLFARPTTDEPFATQSVGPVSVVARPEHVNGVAPVVPKESPPAKPAFAGGTHEVARGDNLWRISEHYYTDPYLWPNVYRVNTDVLESPDVLEPAQVLELPVLYGPPEKLTAEDRRNLAEGYFAVFKYHNQHQRHLAPFALWAAAKYDASILERRRDEISEDDWAFLKAHDVEYLATR